MRDDVVFTQYHDGQLERSTCGGHNFCIEIPFEKNNGLLERYRSVESHKWKLHKKLIFYVKKHNLDPQTGPIMLQTSNLQNETFP